MGGGSSLWMVPVVLAAACVVILLLGKFALSGGKAGPPLRPGWMCMVVGLRGHGKSLFVARLIAKRLAAGTNVVANFPVASGVTRMVSWADCALAPARSMVVLDEGHQWAAAAAGRSLDPLANWYISHSRKLEHEVWIIAQDESQIASGVRSQVNEYVECRKVTAKRHRAASYAPRQFRKAKVKPLWAWWYTPEGAATKVYDTMELVRPVVSEPLTKIETAALINSWIDEIYRRRGLLVEPVTVEPGPSADPPRHEAAAPAGLTSLRTGKLIRA